MPPFRPELSICADWASEGDRPLATDGAQNADSTKDTVAQRMSRLTAEQGSSLAAKHNTGLCILHEAREPKEAAAWFECAANERFAPSEYAMGVLYATGEGVEQDALAARRWIFSAAEHGYARARLCLADCLNDPRKAPILGLREDHSAAVWWYRGAAEQGDLRAKFELSMCLELARGVSRVDLVEALRLRREAAEGGQLEAQYAMGGLIRKANPAEAAGWDRAAAERGHALAQHNMGRNYACGNGVVQDLVEAVHWYRLAAEQGAACAQVNLGQCILAGRGVGRDVAAGLRWLESAASQGDGCARNLLAHLYSSGQVEGVPRDLDRARRVLLQAAEQGYAPSQHTVGVCCMQGLRGFTRDNNDALRWFSRAARQGHSYAQFNVFAVRMLPDVLSTEAEMDEAGMFLRAAASTGLALAQLHLGLMLVDDKRWDRRCVQVARESSSAEEAAAVSMLLAAKSAKHLGECPSLWQSNTEAVKWIQLAAQGADDSCARLSCPGAEQQAARSGSSADDAGSRRLAGIYLQALSSAM